MFTRENTKQIKGIAIILMLIHHLYSYVDRIPYGLEVATDIVVMGYELTKLMGVFSGICVPVFMFLGGYGLYMKVGRCEQSDYANKSLVAHCVKLYQAYWKVFLIFIPLGYLFFSNQVQYCADTTISSRFAEFSLETIFLNFIGIDATIVSEWWFFATYLYALFVGFVFLEALKKNKKIYVELALIIISHILITGVFSSFPWTEKYEELAGNVYYVRFFEAGKWSLYFLIGTIFAKYQVFDAWYKLTMEKLGMIKRVALAIVATIASGGMYVFLDDTGYTLMVVPVFVFVLAMLINSLPIVKKPLALLGAHSTNMWLTHGFFCYYFHPYVKLVYGSKNAVVAFIVLVTLSLGASVLINMIWKAIDVLYGNLRLLVLGKGKV